MLRVIALARMGIAVAVVGFPGTRLSHSRDEEAVRWKLSRERLENSSRGKRETRVARVTKRRDYSLIGRPDDSADPAS